MILLKNIESEQSKVDENTCVDDILLVCCLLSDLAHRLFSAAFAKKLRKLFSNVR